jgi:Cdc6-like AAA superfamily ATPase
MENQDTLLKSLNESFGSFRAEWLKNKIYELFEAPHYFSALQDNRPCILEGGRGTGKTTILRGLSYEGQYELQNKNISKFDAEIDFVGIYHRVNTNHVRAFKGGEIDELKWSKVFSHYINLVLSNEILVFLDWHRKCNEEDEVLNRHDCSIIAKSLGFREKIESFDSLINGLKFEMYSFQSEINDITNETQLKLSLAGEPLNILIKCILGLKQFSNKMFYFLIDEYENFEDYQQKVFNTLIKHSSENYTFKIGVRQLGWRIKHTLNDAEKLNDPADYKTISIEKYLTDDEKLFDDFAKKVCQHRIANLIGNDNFRIEDSLVSISIEEEAILLGVENTELYKDSVKKIPKREKLTPLYKYYLAHWAKKNKRTIEEEVSLYKNDKGGYNTRYDNYKYSLLFMIKRGRGSAGIQKYYAGWETFTKISHGNIRYLMELVHKTFEKHVLEGNSLISPISVRTQTLAAQECGLKNLTEFEGLWKNGAQITKLLLGFGRIFQLLAQNPDVAPEKNQFSISDLNSHKDLNEIIVASIMNLALIRIPGTKLNPTDTKDTLYMIHPLYSPYFQFSYRKKRKMDLNSEDVYLMITHQTLGIQKILAKSLKKEEISQTMPTQMNLFSDYYNG